MTYTNVRYRLFFKPFTEGDSPKSNSEGVEDILRGIYSALEGRLEIREPTDKEWEKAARTQRHENYMRSLRGRVL